MSGRTSTIARGSKRVPGATTNIAMIRGTLVALPLVRVIDRHQRATTFDLASVVLGRRTVVPVVATNMDLPIIKVGDEVTVVGHVRRRFFRVGPRTQSITELVVEQIATKGSAKKIDAIHREFATRGKTLRTSTLG